MILHYLPTNSIVIDEVAIAFSEARELIRARLGGSYKEDNQIIQLRIPGEAPISQRRDIYENLHAKENYFFLNYDENDLLKEVEVHRCERIQVLDTFFGFDDELDVIAMGLSKYSAVDKKGEGEYFLKDLKISIIDEERMGGEGNMLGYFYCAADVTHLEEELSF